MSEENDLMGNSGFTPTEDMSWEKILSEFFNSDNIDLKTDIKDPSAMAGLKTIENELRTYGLIKSANSIKTFLDYYKKYVVSENRQSRKEVIQGLSYLKDKKELSTKDRLTKNLTEI